MKIVLSSITPSVRWALDYEGDLISSSRGEREVDGGMNITIYRS